MGVKQLKPFTTETQRHRENLTTQRTMWERDAGDCLYLLEFVNWWLSPWLVSMSLCLCGENVFGVKS